MKGTAARMFTGSAGSSSCWLHGVGREEVLAEGHAFPRRLDTEVSVRDAACTLSYYTASIRVTGVQRVYGVCASRTYRVGTVSWCISLERRLVVPPPELLDISAARFASGRFDIRTESPR